MYGQSGLEASLDNYLRGLLGNPDLSIWWNYLLYGQPPPGLDVRLTLDSQLQDTADTSLGSRIGALVLLNAENGDILAMASHPTFDANQLDQAWSGLVEDKRSPLFNRSTLGQYPPGAALGPLFLAAAYAGHGPRAGPPAFPQSLAAFEQDNPSFAGLGCAVPASVKTWEDAIAAGCPGPVAFLGSTLKSEDNEDAILTFLNQVFVSEDAATIGVPASASMADIIEAGTDKDNDPLRLVLGQAGLRVSPLQMSLAAAALSKGVIRPIPRLVMTVDHPETGWVILPDARMPTKVLDEKAADRVAQALMIEGIPIWQSLARLPDGAGNTFTWYLAGTLPDWNGTPLALALILEEDDPMAASEIGQSVLKAALQPDRNSLN